MNCRCLEYKGQRQPGESPARRLCTRSMRNAWQQNRYAIENEKENGGSMSLEIIVEELGEALLVLLAGGAVIGMFVMLLTYVSSF